MIMILEKKTNGDFDVRGIRNKEVFAEVFLNFRESRKESSDRKESKFLILGLIPKQRKLNFVSYLSIHIQICPNLTDLLS